MEVIIGTYEEFLIGFQLKSIDGCHKFEQSFTDRAHCGSVRCVSSSAKLIASGSSDEVIRIFNMSKRNDCGTLVQHSGTITHLEFFKNTHLFSSSEDSTICVWDTRNWNCDKTLRGHKDAVNSMSVHPSGKLLLSVSKDKTLRTWNLIKGRCAYITNLKTVAHIVLWSPSSTLFAVAVDKRVDIYDITVGGIVHSYDFGKRVNCLLFLNNEVILIGGDCNDIKVYNIQKKCILNTFTAHENRLKSFQSISNYSEVKENKLWVASVSSDGFIKLWEFDSTQLETDPTLIASIDSTCRPTSMTVWIPDNTSNENLSQTSELVVADQNLNTVSKKRKNKSKEKVLNKKEKV